MKKVEKVKEVIESTIINYKKLGRQQKYKGINYKNLIEEKL